MAWQVELLGWKKRGDRIYFAGYSGGEQLTEFTLYPDVSIAILSKFKKAAEGKKTVAIDITNVEKTRSINWTLSAKTQEFLNGNISEEEYLKSTASAETSGTPSSQPKSPRSRGSRRPRTSSRKPKPSQDSPK